MKKILSISAIMLVAGWCGAQLVNQGGTITIQSGAKLFVESNVENNVAGANTGTIIIDGELEVQGDFTNNGTLTTNAGSLLTFSGDANSNFTSGGAVVRNLKMDKDHATSGTVTLVDNLSVSDTLIFSPASASNINHLVIGANDLLLTQQSTVILNPTSADYIVAEDAGMVQKAVDADGTFTYPIGDANNYSPLDVAYASGNSTYTAANIRVNVDNVVHPNKPAAADDFIARYWNVDQTGIGGYSADLTGTYVAGDVTGTASEIQGAVYDSNNEWIYNSSKDGLVIAIEPMITLGNRRVVQKDDGWTIKTKDNKVAAHYEHTVAIRKEKADILSSHTYLKEEIKKSAYLIDI